MPSLTLGIPHDSELSRRILNELRVRVRESQRVLTVKHKEWREAEERTLAFLPEREIDAERRERREGGKPQFTTIQIPYSYAVLLAAHTYIVSVFLNRSPVHQFTGRHGESQQNIQALEAVIDYQALVGGLLAPYYTWFYDSLKFGIGCLGVFWEDRFEHISQVVETPTLDVLGLDTGRTEKSRITMRSRTYSGNRVYNIQPWDFLWDTRYPARLFQKGEYLAIKFSLGWNEAKRREAAGFYMNLDKLGRTSPQTFDSSQAAGSSQLDRPETTDPSNTTQSEFSELSPTHPSLINGYEVYVDLIPKEWGLGALDHPEKWVFTTSGDFKTLIGAQPLGAIHSQFPAAVLPLEPEGYGLTTRGMAKTLEPVQNTIDWLINTHFYNVRASLNNQFIVDPSRTVMKDWLNPSAGKIIRLKPEAYGQDTKTAWSQVNVNDVTQNHLRDLQLMLNIGERTVGVNDQILGALNQGGRKTATEVRTSTSFGVNRLKTIAEWFSAIGFSPLAQMLVQNTQQYYDQEQKFKIAGDLIAGSSPAFLDVNPDMLSGFYDFVPVDGTMPIDRFAQANLWREMLAQITRIPQIAMRYDLGGIFEYVAQLAGLKNITRFKVQMTPEEELLLQAQAGNVVPAGPGQANGAGGSPQTSTSGNPPAQVSGLGPSQ